MNVKLCSHSLMIACFWLLPLSAAAQVHAQAQQYPSKSVTIISDSAAGSTPDAVLRVIADRLSQSWGQQVLAVNHPGAAGSIASRIAADSPPDGYTLYMPVLSTFVSLPGAAPNLPIQLPRDFTAIGSRPKIPCSSWSLPRSASKTSPISSPERKGVQTKYLVLSPASAGSRI